MLKSGVLGDNQLLTRCAPRRRVVIRREVSAAITSAATLHQLPRDNFSSKSLRSGFTTYVTSNGATRQDTNRRGVCTAVDNVGALPLEMTPASKRIL